MTSVGAIPGPPRPGAAPTPYLRSPLGIEFDYSRPGEVSMYAHSRKPSLIVKLAVGVAITMIAGCTPSTEKPGQPVNMAVMASTPTPIPLPTTAGVPTPTPSPIPADVPTPTPVSITPVGSAASTYKYPLPMFSTTWALSPGVVTSIAIGPDNTRWFATSNGVFRFADGTWTQFTTADGLPENHIASINVAPDGAVWASTLLNGIFKFDGETWEEVGEIGIDNTGVEYALYPAGTGMAIASNGDMWAIIGLRGIFSFDGTNWKRHTRTADGLPTAEYFKLLAIATGPDGTVWFSALALADGRALLLHNDGMRWTSHAVPDMPRVNYITSLAFPRDGSIWVGGNAGEAPEGSLAHFDGATWTIYTAANGLADDYIHNIAVAPDDRLWFTTSQGVYRFDGNTCETISNTKAYYSIAISPAGEAWLGGWGEVTRIPPMKN